MRRQSVVMLAAMVGVPLVLGGCGGDRSGSPTVEAERSMEIVTTLDPGSTTTGVVTTTTGVVTTTTTEASDPTVYLITDEYSAVWVVDEPCWTCLLYTSPSPRDQRGSRMPSSA